MDPGLDTTAGTWDSTAKLAVEGSVDWAAATYSEVVTGGKRVLTSKDVPLNTKSGNFQNRPPDDPSSAYDKNPGSITEQATTLTISEHGTEAGSASCLPEGPVGMLRNGVLVFNSLDGRGHRRGSPRISGFV